jgi:hypothetical protein
MKKNNDIFFIRKAIRLILNEKDHVVDIFLFFS